MYNIVTTNGELYHYGVKGMKWGVRRYQNKDGTLTTSGRQHYGFNSTKEHTKKKPSEDKTRFASDALRFGISATVGATAVAGLIASVGITPITGGLALARVGKATLDGISLYKDYTLKDE
jgi:hypothetical protein